MVRLAVAAILFAMLAVATVVVWTSDDAGESPQALTGQELFQVKGCSGCHIGPGVDSGFEIGPDLSQLAAVAAERSEGLDAEAYVRQSITQPSAFVVPRYGDQMPTLPLEPAEIDALVEYLLDDSVDQRSGT